MDKELEDILQACRGTCDYGGKNTENMTYQEESMRCEHILAMLIISMEYQTKSLKYQSEAMNLPRMANEPSANPTFL